MKTNVIDIFKKLPKIVSSCNTELQLIYAQKWCHLAYKTTKSRTVRVLGTKMLQDKRINLRARG